LKVFIIGSGNVAYHMVRAIWKTDSEIVGLYSRNDRDARACVRGEKVDLFDDLSAIPTSADLYLICVNDDSISEIVSSLSSDIKESKIVAHTSGSQSIDVLENVESAGVFYPVQTFTKGRKMTYEDIPFCISSNNDNVETQLSALADKISGNVNIISDDQRKKIHLSAVMMNNFVNHLIYKSEEFLEKNELPIELIQPLLKQTIAKHAKLGSLEAQTGPAVRNDESTINAHIDMLTSDLDKELYKAISSSITETHKK
jgi:predicted short-subunit dehydrogenase-like oxidoreductase (DUF2520 family)